MGGSDGLALAERARRAHQHAEAMTELDFKGFGPTDAGSIHDMRGGKQHPWVGPLGVK